MRFAERALGPALLEASRQFPSLILTGPRRAGKTTLLRHLFPRAAIAYLEDPAEIQRVRADPRGFLEDLGTPAMLDEVQNVPELFNYVRARIDEHPRKMGRWFFTGSQDAPLMKGVTESMAGRAAIFQLLPMSRRESPKVSIVKGGYPEVLANPRSAENWFRSYIQTYLERDVRAVSSIRDLSTFRRFLSLVATRSGSIMNRTEIAAPLGVAVSTVSEWLGILEVTGQIMLIPPFFENFGKRLIKSPKLYFVDSGLACHLLDIQTEAALRRSPFMGPLFEGFVASEFTKDRVNRGKRHNLYYFRDQQGLEVDFVLDQGNRNLILVEAKATRTPKPDMTRSLRALAKSVGPYQTSAWLVHSGPDGSRSLASGIRSVGIAHLEDLYGGTGASRIS